MNGFGNNLIGQEPWAVRGADEGRIRAAETTLALVQTGAWTSWTPALRQNGASVAATVNTARYTKIGRTVHGQFILTAAAVGSSGTIDVSLPVTTISAASGNISLGAGLFYVLSTAKRYNVIAEELDTGRMYFIDDINNASLGIGLALGIGDILRIHFTYEAAS